MTPALRTAILVGGAVFVFLLVVPIFGFVLRAAMFAFLAGLVAYLIYRLVKG